MHDMHALKVRETRELLPGVHIHKPWADKEMPFVNLKETITEKNSKTSKDSAFPKNRMCGVSFKAW